ncbi:hypothetical protein Ddye_001058 [Dipteronia dyeriana]|uniref:CCHC-type domain-containing protein n=1 Tax=Dipteronia dyeriana TaxID=168575 RepID=A0AAE0CT66_9ROSI|nr:hypothetical protein Ddye_001058 [Dipteronia dyeriana]
MDKAAYAYTKSEYNRHMEELRNLHHNAYDYVIDIGPHKWSRVHCPERRYRVMKTNIAECINSCLKFTRQLPMLTLAEFIRNTLQREQNLDLTSLCSNYYKRRTLIDAYSVPIMPIGHPSTWVVPSDIAQMVILNPICRRQAGRPRAGRHVLSSERTTTQSCRRYGQPGHNSRRCSNPHWINEGPSKGVPDEYRYKCSICHSIGHNKQTCRNMDSNRELKVKF